MNALSWDVTGSEHSPGLDQRGYLNTWLWPWGQATSAAFQVGRLAVQIPEPVFNKVSR